MLAAGRRFHFPPPAYLRVSHLGNMGARPRKEDLLRAFSCLAISAIFRQKPASDSKSCVLVLRVTRSYVICLLKIAGKRGARV